MLCDEQKRQMRERERAKVIEYLLLFPFRGEEGNWHETNNKIYISRWRKWHTTHQKMLFECFSFQVVWVWWKRERESLNWWSKKAI